MNSRLDKVCDFYADFRQAGLWQLPELYADDCQFQDPVQEVNGLDSLIKYFDRMAASLNFCRFEFHSRYVQDDHACLSWTMQFSHPRLQQGETLLLQGMTELQFAEDKIRFHRDYYDLGAMLYEHLPILGPVIRSVKSRIA